LEQGKYALHLSWTSQEIGDEVYTDPGMYMAGLGNMLVEFPSTFQTMYFSHEGQKCAEGDDDCEKEEDKEFPPIRRPPMRARSADGLEMTVSLSFQWQLHKESLKPLYWILGGGAIEESLYRDEFVRFARAAIVESCSNFAADFFFTNRRTITANMLDKVTKAFDQADIGLDVKIRGLQLREVDLPDLFDEEIVRTQEQMQEVQVALAERDEQRIMMERDLVVAEERVNRIEQEAHAQAEKTRLLNEAIVGQTLYFQEKQAESNADVLSEVWNSTDPWQRLFEMMEIRGLNVHNDGKLLINL
jgi:regulator of protease activity HflC (stomatin/prohibitin superfamily)